MPPRSIAQPRPLRLERNGPVVGECGECPIRGRVFFLSVHHSVLPCSNRPAVARKISAWMLRVAAWIEAGKDGANG